MFVLVVQDNRQVYGPFHSMDEAKRFALEKLYGTQIELSKAERLGDFWVNVLTDPDDTEAD